jgi:hypothetical protein
MKIIASCVTSITSSYLLYKVKMAEANETDQNDCPIVIKFGYTNYKVDETTKVASANCKKCKALIKEKAGTTSAFIRHLSVNTHDYLRGE